MAQRDRSRSKKTSKAPLTAALRERTRGASKAAPRTKSTPTASEGTLLPAPTRRSGATDDDSFRDMLAMELVVVAPLPGALRVPLTAGTTTARNAGRRAVRQKQRQVQFVVERDAYGTTAYRVDLGERALEPLRRRWAPQSRLDLHGRSTSELEPALLRAIRAERSQGIRRLLVIHGKGLHSRDGHGVLAEAVVDILTEGALASSIRAFCTAPAALGGSGALAVELDLP